MEKSVREQILQILLVPSTVTEIKNKLPKIKSFGTIAYHLDKLETKGIITKKKDSDKRGQPTTYKLSSKKDREWLEQSIKQEMKNKLIVLKLIKAKEYISLDELYELGDEFDDIHFNTTNNGLATLHFRLTEKGARFLTKNDGKKS